ncbi:unnamed protein product [Ectocarpus sp. 12 AP-2014]
MAWVARGRGDCETTDPVDEKRLRNQTKLLLPSEPAAPTILFYETCCRLPRVFRSWSKLVDDGGGVRFDHVVTPSMALCGLLPAGHLSNLTTSITGLVVGGGALLSTSILHLSRDLFLLCSCWYGIGR